MAAKRKGWKKREASAGSKLVRKTAKRKSRSGDYESGVSRPSNALYYGDNLEVLREQIADQSVDLVYLDPPFNSNQDYNLLFEERDGSAAAAQIRAFEDTWRWDQGAEDAYGRVVEEGGKMGEALLSLRKILHESDMMAYLAMMAPRLWEIRRALKPTGSVYLHCDPTASHYLKLLMDAVFNPSNFRNEIIWKRTGAKGLQSRRLAQNHDVILSYQMGDEAKWNADEAIEPYDLENLDEKTDSKYSQRDANGRRYQLTSLINPNSDRPNLTYEFLGVTRVWRWTRERMQKAFDDGLVVQTKAGAVPRFKRYLDEQKGKPLGDVWADIAPINARAAERLGYPTQKPTALLERILRCASDEGDVVLDPFCGCGTTIDAAQRLGRSWIGIDVTVLALGLIEKRLRGRYGDSITDSYSVTGIPTGVAEARALFESSPLDFERWVVMALEGRPNEVQSGDRGVDGRIRFRTGSAGEYGLAIVSVKGGKQVNPSMVRDLVGTAEAEEADIGILALMESPTKGMKQAAASAGTYLHKISGHKYPRIQLVTVSEILDGKRPAMPTPDLPYVRARQYPGEQTQLPLVADGASKSGRKRA